MLPYDAIDTKCEEFYGACCEDEEDKEDKNEIHNHRHFSAYSKNNYKINFGVYTVFGQYSKLPIYCYNKDNFLNLRKCLLNDNIIWKLLVDGRYHHLNDPYIFDNDRTEGGIKRDGEKGWLENMKNGFKFILNNCDKFDNIIERNDRFCAIFFNNYYANLHKHILPGANSIYNNKCYIGIGNHNGNYEGLLEFFIKSEKNDLHKGWDRYLAPDVREKKLVERKIKFKLNKKDYDISICKNGNSIVHELDSGEIVSFNLPVDMIRTVNEDISDILKSERKEYTIGYKFEDYQMAYKNLKKMFVHGNIGFVGELDKGLLEENKYNLQPVQCSREEKIIALIVNLCQDLDIAHFFLDGNTRTAYVFLNQMLITHGFLPTILDNPNKLEFTDIKTLFLEVIKGQKRVLDLLSQKEELKKSIPTIKIVPH